MAAVACAEAADKANYADFGESVDPMGLNWEPYEVTAEDGQILTVFRVWGSEIDPDTLPIYAVHGSGSVAADWFPTWLPGLAYQGYELWLASTRGRQYANTNTTDMTFRLKEKWDFTLPEMSLLDTPVMIEKALEISGKSKITLVGYS